MTKKVSVVMCTYNGEKYLREQIDSILGQTYPIYELIIQDDVSTDHTVDILKKYGDDTRIKVYINERRLGIDANFNSALLHVRGDFIALSDQDDIWCPDKIEKLVKNIQNNALLFHDSFLFTTDIRHLEGRKNVPNVNLHEAYILMKPYVAGHACFFRKEILPKILEVTTQEPTVSFDTLICLIGCVYGGIAYLDECLTYWRRHPSAASYAEKEISKVGFVGIINAIIALGDRKRRKTTKSYFQLISRLDFNESLSREIVKYMGSGRTIGILQSCWICLKNRSLFYPNQAFYKSFFIPLYFNRDYGSFIIG